MKKVSTFVGSVLVAWSAILLGSLAYGQIAAETAPAQGRADRGSCSRKIRDCRSGG